jgi:hypothetical protein
MKRNPQPWREGNDVRAWIGKSIVAIGLLHTGVGAYAFRARLAEILHEGLINTVDGTAERAFPFWFLVCGIVWIIFGAFVDWFERAGHSFPPFLGWTLLAFTALLIIAMPVSGMWLLIVPAVGAIRRSGPSGR